MTKYEEQDTTEASPRWTRRRVIQGIGVGALVFPSAVFGYQHLPHPAYCENSVSSQDEGVHPIIKLPGDKFALMDVDFIGKNSVKIMLADSKLSSWRIDASKMGPGPEITYHANANTDLLVDVTPDEVRTSCQTPLLTTP